MTPETVLVVAAHPDDETLGCGGTIARWSSEGTKVHVAFLTDGVGARDKNSQAEEVKRRQSAGNAAASILGVTSTCFFDLPDNQLDSIPLLSIAKKVEELVGRFTPDLVITHHAGDLNIDHRIVHSAVVTACRPQKGHPVKTILCFEVPSSTEWQSPGALQAFEPQCYVDISDSLTSKLAALSAYSDEMRSWPHPRSIEAVTHLGRWRGATVGVDAAEAFMLVRHIG